MEMRRSMAAVNSRAIDEKQKQRMDRELDNEIIMVTTYNKYSFI